MSATKTRAALPTPKFDKKQGPDHVGLGDVVYWYDGDPAACPPFPAVVTRVGLGTQLTLAVVAPDRGTLQVKDGAKRHDDATLRDDERLSNGVWDYHPRTKEFLKLQEQVRTLLEPAPAAGDKPKK